MKESFGSGISLRNAKVTLLGLTVLALLVGLLAWDLWTPLGFADWVLYVPLVLISLWLPFYWDSVILAATSTAFMIIGYFYSPAGLEPTLALFNRFLGMTVVWIIATGCFLQKDAWRALKNHETQLRALAMRLDKVREEESTRIARDIHDQLGQELTALKVSLSLAAQQVQSLPPAETKDRFQTQLVSMISLVNSAIKSVQHIASDLRPLIVGEQGVVSAIEWLCREFQKRTGTECRFQSTLRNVGLGVESSTTVFRVAQEALTNITRHAKATLATMTLEERNGVIVMRVKDNGIGISISQEEAANTESLGLIGMRERAMATGGEVSISGQPGHGTTVELKIPAGTMQEV